MIQHSNRRLAALFLASDLIATLVALAAAYWLRFDAEIIPVTKGVPRSRLPPALPYIAVVWPLVYYFHGLYQVRRSRSSVEEGLAVLVATALATLLLIGIATFSRGFDYSRAVLVLFFAADVLFVFAGRTAIRRYLEEAWRHGYGVRRVLVVGAGRLGRAVVDKLADHPRRDCGPWLRGRRPRQARRLLSGFRRRPHGDVARSSKRSGSTPSSSLCRWRRTAPCWRC